MFLEALAISGDKPFGIDSLGIDRVEVRSQEPNEVMETHPNPVAGFFNAQALESEEGKQLFGNTDSCRSSTEEKNSLLGQRCPRGSSREASGIKEPREDNRTCFTWVNMRMTS